MKTNYSTIILRYVHDVVTGEFANIGVVLYAPDRRFLEARFAASCERLNAIFLKIAIGLHGNQRYQPCG